MIYRGYIGCTTTAQIRFIWGVYWSEQRKSDFSPRPPNDTVIKAAGDPRAVTSLWGSKRRPVSSEVKGLRNGR